jgi:hypothetical protein
MKRMIEPMKIKRIQRAREIGAEFQVGNWQNEKDSHRLCKPQYMQAGFKRDGE